MYLSSYSDIITNSSSTIYANIFDIEPFKKMINSLLRMLDIKQDFSDLFHLEQVFEYDREYVGELFAEDFFNDERITEKYLSFLESKKANIQTLQKALKEATSVYDIAETIEPLVKEYGLPNSCLEKIRQAYIDNYETPPINFTYKITSKQNPKDKTSIDLLSVLTQVIDFEEESN